MLYQVKRGDFWKYQCDVRIIPVNSSAKGPAGNIVLNNSLAQIVCWRWPSFAWQVALHEQKYDLQPAYFPQQRLISFPVRNDPRQESVSLGQVERSAIQLADLLDGYPWESVLLSLEGLTGGEERFEQTVRDIIALHLDRPCVVLMERAAAPIG